jgi:valyl-tRNA synthetase
VDNKELPGRTLLDVPGYDRKVEFGIIVHFKYPIENSEETIEVATTRPETMLGDSGIAVHPEDPRYTHLLGKFAVHPFIEGRRLPIVADRYVDREFGTGAVKLTPAHDPNDFKLGMTHNLEFINVLTDDGLINENGGPYQGQKRFDVRYSIQEDLKKLGLYVDKKDNPMSVPLSERTKDVVEPLVKPQWWVKMADLTEPAVRPTTYRPFSVLCLICSYLSHRSKQSKPVRSRSSPSRRRGATSTGWQTSTTGASQDSCGGDIGAPCIVFASKERRTALIPTTGGSRDELRKKVWQFHSNTYSGRPMLIRT